LYVDHTTLLLYRMIIAWKILQLIATENDLWSSAAESWIFHN